MCIKCRTWGLLWTAAKMVYCILHLWYGAHTWNTTSHFILCCFKCCAAGRDVKNAQSVLTHTHCTLHGALHALIRYRTAWRFMKKSDWEPRRAATWALNAWNFSAQGYISLSVSDLQASGQLKGFMSGVLVNITHRSHLSRFLDCHKYWVDVFISIPFIHKKSGIKATNY